MDRTGKRQTLDALFTQLEDGRVYPNADCRAALDIIGLRMAQLLDELGDEGMDRNGALLLVLHVGLGSIMRVGGKDYAKAFLQDTFDIIDRMPPLRA